MTIEQMQQKLQSIASKKNITIETIGEGIINQKAFLKTIGNPQEKIKIIHVAGTSGKGSITKLCQTILMANSYKVGSSSTPHLHSWLEMFEINNQAIDLDVFELYYADFLSKVQDWQTKTDQQLTYFEILGALTYYVFYRERVDFAVIEVGMGGRYDYTNVIENPDKVCILNSIGLDHTEFLGNTLQKIAYQKAGIIQQNNTVFALLQDGSVNQVFEEVALEKQANLTFVDTDNITKNTCLNNNYTSFEYLYQGIWKDIELGLIGIYQASNFAMAVHACDLALKRLGANIDWQKTIKALKDISLAGRFSIIKKDNLAIVVDGAHNPQKIQAFIQSLKKTYPNQKFTFLCSFVDTKDIKKELELILPICQKLFYTTFSINVGIPKQSMKPEYIEPIFQEFGFDYYINEDTQNSIKEAEDYAKKNNTILVITGSLYLIRLLGKI